MALNITFNGFTYDKDSTIGDSTIYYQGYFYSNGTASSTSAWNTVRTCEASGYYNINVGSADWLGQEGTALNGAKVVIVFWKGGPVRTADCSVLTEWGAFELDLDGSDTYSNDAQTMDNIDPDLHWTTNIPVDAYVETTYTVTNTSEDEHSWVYGTTTMYHWYTRYSQIINGPNFIDYTNYYWGDGETSLNESGTTNGSHSWDLAGAYDVTTEVFDDCSASVSGTESFNIYWREPVPNIIMTPSSPEPNEPVSFSYTGADIDDRITSIEWTIEDTGAYGTTNTTTTVSRDTTVAHTDGEGTDWYGQGQTSGAFTNPGSHTVSIVINWNDGFDNQTINYNDDFTQNLFTGPTLGFTQDPVLAEVGSSITFTNTSTDVDRVGLGLPEHEEYSWNWDDNGTTAGVQDVDHAYQFIKIPTTAECLVELCADWSDGWETMSTCLEEAVTFRTTVTVTPEDCYYSINVVGTSSDGTVDSYNWTVSSGISETGPWNVVWESPIDIDQQQKTLCFSSTGWYMVTGYVNGNGTTTSDYDTLLITETCPDSAAIHNIWNGTGVLDIEADWLRSGTGEETTVSKYRGTNGLDVTYGSGNTKVEFYRDTEYNINDYDFLSFWINVREWDFKKDVNIKLWSTNGSSGSEVNLSTYVNTSDIGTWKKVMIPLHRFNLKSGTVDMGWPTLINRLRFLMKGKISFWLDNVALTMGSLVTVPVCEPELETALVGELSMTATVVEPPSINISVRGTSFPGPLNL